MIFLNSAIWNQTISEAKAKSGNNAYILGRIDAAVIEIAKTNYWSFDPASGVLKLKSTNKKIEKLCTVTSIACTFKLSDGTEGVCPSKTVCRHRVMQRLLTRYSAKLAETQAAQAEIAQAAEGVKLSNMTTGNLTSGARYAKKMCPYDRAKRAAFWERLAATPFFELDRVTRNAKPQTATKQFAR